MTCQHEDVKTFRSHPPHSKCLQCGLVVEQRWVAVEATPLDFLPGLQDALHSARTGAGVAQHGRACTLCIIIRHTRTGGPREHLEAQVSGTMSGTALQRALHALDLPMTRETIRNHRNEGHTP